MTPFLQSAHYQPKAAVLLLLGGYQGAVATADIRCCSAQQYREDMEGLKHINRHHWH